MFFQVQVQYRTPAGEYRSAACNLDHSQVYQHNDFVQRWALSHLPEGSFLVSVKMGWVSLPPEEVILRRFHVSWDDASNVVPKSV